jgi:predicted RNase H-like HicB family nuclease
MLAPVDDSFLMPLKAKRQVLLYLGEDGYFVAEVPSLSGCVSQGKTRAEALVNI